MTNGKITLGKQSGGQQAMIEALKARIETLEGAK